MKVNILGTEYTIEYHKAAEDQKISDGCDGYCDTSVKLIVVEEMERAYTMQVPLVAECGVGENWLEAH